MFRKSNTFYGAYIILIMVCGPTKFDPPKVHIVTILNNHIVVWYVTIGFDNPIHVGDITLHAAIYITFRFKLPPHQPMLLFAPQSCIVPS